MRINIAVDGVPIAPINAANGDSILFTVTGAGGKVAHTSVADGELRRTVKLMSEAPSFKLAKRIARQRGHLT